MRFLIDAQLPPALARLIVEQGFAAEHVADVGLARASDREIWEFAKSVGAIVVTKDEDFAQRKIFDDGGPRIVWVRSPNTRKRALLIWFVSVLPLMTEALERGETLVEIA